MKPTITVRLDEDLKRQLDEISQRSGCSRSDVVRDALRRHLSLLTFNRLHMQIRPFAKARGSLTDENIFRGITLAGSSRSEHAASVKLCWKTRQTAPSGRS